MRCIITHRLHCRTLPATSCLLNIQRQSRAEWFIFVLLFRCCARLWLFFFITSYWLPLPGCFVKGFCCTSCWSRWTWLVLLTKARNLCIFLVGVSCTVTFVIRLFLLLFLHKHNIAYFYANLIISHRVPVTTRSHIAMGYWAERLWKPSFRMLVICRERSGLGFHCSSSCCNCGKNVNSHATCLQAVIQAVDSKNIVFIIYSFTFTVNRQTWLCWWKLSLVCKILNEYETIR
jgi:hypothetical protein